MSRVLTLTTPHMKGADVKAAQAALAQHGYLTADGVDGEFGPITAGACKSAKVALGYAAKDCTPMFDVALNSFLSGKVKPTIAMRLRVALIRKQAAAAQAASPVGARAADRMVTWYQAGWKEYPAGSNIVPALQQLLRNLGEPSWICSMGQPWCALSSMSAGLAEGSSSAKAGLIGQHFNALYCPDLKTQASAAKFGMRAVPKSTIKKGTYILFDWPPADGTMDHVGIALGGVGQNVNAGGKIWTVPANSICTVEGNANDAVQINVHDLSVVGFAFTIS